MIIHIVLSLCSVIPVVVCDDVVNVIVGIVHVGDDVVVCDGIGIDVGYIVSCVDVLVVVDAVDAFVCMHVDGDDVSIYVIYVATCFGDDSSHHK